MPHAQINGASLYYSVTGNGPETLFFVHGLAFDGRMFDAQIEHFKSRYRCVAMDLRGHGQSELTEDGYDMENMADDAVALIRHLDLGRCHFVGWSIGGFMGMRIAIRHPDLLKSLTLIGTAAIDGSETDFGFKAVPVLTRLFGMGAVTGSLMSAMFAKPFLRDPERSELRDTWRGRFRADRPLGVARAARGVIRQASVESELGSITTPTVMLRGEFDAVVRLEPTQRTVDRIRGATLVSIERAGHGCTIEEPDQVERAIESFLLRLAADAAQACG